MTTIAPETPMEALADRGEPLTDVGEPYMYLEVNTEERQAVVCFVEPLRFHAELAQADEERFDRRPGTTWHKWSELTDDAGYLTADSITKLTAELKNLIIRQTGVDAEVDYGREYDDEPSFGFEIVTTYEAGETFDSWFDRAGWPIVATIINVTDPGTFNCPYLFSAILYR